MTSRSAAASTFDLSVQALAKDVFAPEAVSASGGCEEASMVGQSALMAVQPIVEDFIAMYRVTT